MDLIDTWGELSSEEQVAKLTDFINNLDSENEEDRKKVIPLWRETRKEAKMNIDSETFSKLIDAMKNDTRRLFKIWFLTPEELQERESASLGTILEYSSDNAKRYQSVWRTTSPRVQEKYKDVAEKMDILDRLESVNSKVTDTINIGMLDSKYTSTLTFEQLQMLTCYPKDQERLFELTDEQYAILTSATRDIPDVQIWKYEFSCSLANIYGFSDLIANLSSNPEQDIDYSQVLNVLHQPNYFNLRSYEDVQNIDAIKSRVFEAVKNDDQEVIDEYQGLASLSPLDRKRLVLLEYMYSMNPQNVEVILRNFGKDILNLSETEENKKLQEILLNARRILEATDEKELAEFFERDDIARSDTDVVSLEINLKKAYNEEFNKVLTQVDTLPPIAQEKQEELDLAGMTVLDGGVDFNFIVTSIAPYNSNFPKDFCEDWNRKETASQGFCTSYIRNDMLGHAPVPHLCYGFSSMGSNSLMMSGIDDIASNTSEAMIESTVYDNVEFHTPQNQIDMVHDGSQYGFNEMVYNRIQDGKKKQPDFIIAFMKDGKIPNARQIKLAVEQYKAKGIELPVVVIDEDRCIESEKAKLSNMIGEFSKNPTQEMFEQIKQKTKNNSVANQMDFYEFSAYIYNDYEVMREVATRVQEEKTPEEWMDRCQKWYETPEKLPEKAKRKFVEVKKKITDAIKSKLSRKKQGEKVVTDDERDDK